MKRFRIKALVIAGLAVASVVLLAANPPELGTERFQVEKTDLQEDLSGIAKSDAELQELRAQRKADRIDGDKQAVIIDRKLIKKAKADKKWHKAYLRADKADLKQDYRLLVKEQKADLKAVNKQLADAKRDLRCATRKDDAAGVKSASAEVVSLLAAKSAEESQLADLRSDRKEDLLAVNRSIGKVNGQFAGLLAAERLAINMS
jgi:hypothetical protein